MSPSTVRIENLKLLCGSFLIRMLSQFDIYWR